MKLIIAIIIIAMDVAIVTRLTRRSKNQTHVQGSSGAARSARTYVDHAEPRKQK